MSKIPTAIEVLLDPSLDMDVEAKMIYFAKLHCEEQAKQISEKAQAYIGCNDEPLVSKGSILMSYSLDNIK